MQDWKRMFYILIAGVAIVAVAILIGGIVLTHFLVDLWWYQSLDMQNYFWLRLLYRYILSGGVTLFFFLIFFLNFWAASRYLGVDETTYTELAKTRAGTSYQNALSLFQTGSLRAYLPLSIFLAVIMATPFYQEWESALLYFFGPDSGVPDPTFGKDVSFYLFSYPIYHLIQSELFGVFVTLALAIALLYWIEHHIVPTQQKEWPLGARIHLTGLFILTFMIAAWGIFMHRYELLYTDIHEPVFFGPGFVEMRYKVPLIWCSVLTLLSAGLVAAIYIHTRKGLKVLAALGLLFLVSLGLRQIEFIPKTIDRFFVKPNPVKIEYDFMKHNIDATLAAYDLDEVEYIDYDVDPLHKALFTPGIQQVPLIQQILKNIPVWDTELLDDVYQQMQGIRPYYHFTKVDVGRYEINGRSQQVNLAAREVNIKRLPKEAQNWENTHLRYTHGYGVVMTPAAQKGGEPMEWYIKDLSLQSEAGFKIDKPDIYYGEEDLDYAIVPNKLNVVGISTTTDPDSNTNITSLGGIHISSLFRKLLLSLYLRDEKMFFPMNIDSNSKLLLKRNIKERVKTLTPYLELDEDPYFIVAPDRVYWVLDAYTISDRYPISKFTDFKFEEHHDNHRFNYIRNSVKVVVDAFDGTVSYYITDEHDPIIKAYKNAYPGIFKDMQQMPLYLRQHLRHPHDIFEIQMGIYTKYHQTQPELFYQQAETWDFSKLGGERVKPYYLTVSLPGCPQASSFVLVSAMTPITRNNLSVLAVAGFLNFEDCNASGKTDKLVMYKISPRVQVEGPAQIGALIDQDPEISQQFSLWDQSGAHLTRGKVLILPVAKSVLYVQPVYITSRGTTKIPELARVILALGDNIVMESSLDKAFEKLIVKMTLRKTAAEQKKNSEQQKTGTPDSGTPTENPANQGQ